MAKKLSISRTVCSTMKAHLNLKKLIASELHKLPAPKEMHKHIQFKMFYFAACCNKPHAPRNEPSDNSLKTFWG